MDRATLQQSGHCTTPIPQYSTVRPAASHRLITTPRILFMHGRAPLPPPQAILPCAAATSPPPPSLIYCCARISHISSRASMGAPSGASTLGLHRSSWMPSGPRADSSPPSAPVHAKDGGGASGDVVTTGDDGLPKKSRSTTPITSASVPLARPPRLPPSLSALSPLLSSAMSGVWSLPINKGTSLGGGCAPAAAFAAAAAATAASFFRAEWVRFSTAAADCSSTLGLCLRALAAPRVGVSPADLPPLPNTPSKARSSVRERRRPSLLRGSRPPLPPLPSPPPPPPAWFVASGRPCSRLDVLVKRLSIFVLGGSPSTGLLGGSPSTGPATGSTPDMAAPRRGESVPNVLASEGSPSGGAPAAASESGTTSDGTEVAEPVGIRGDGDGRGAGGRAAVASGGHAAAAESADRRTGRGSVSFLRMVVGQWRPPLPPPPSPPPPPTPPLPPPPATPPPPPPPPMSTPTTAAAPAASSGLGAGASGVGTSLAISTT
ncbi:hypothetical protein I4F81_010010 [Pyropia yezoensis]|uniref:Uncharacterized protein n=1 Tax=Pyropia yezoensis TaxID=2788 RepID=A0ACC3CBP2_PYRYE|nr:hypothetical protein I4F81_010010 [Neopyropia yezoensis]